MRSSGAISSADPRDADGAAHVRISHPCGAVSERAHRRDGTVPQGFQEHRYVLSSIKGAADGAHMWAWRIVDVSGCSRAPINCVSVFAPPRAVPEIQSALAAAGAPVFEKTQFSMLTPEVREVIGRRPLTSAIIVGIEVSAFSRTHRSRALTHAARSPTSASSRHAWICWKWGSTCTCHSTPSLPSGLTTGRLHWR